MPGAEGGCGGVVVLVVAYAVAAVAVPWALGRHGRLMALSAAVLPAVTAGWALARAGDDVTASVGWASDLGLAIDLRLDALAVVMLVLVGGVGAVVLCYSGWYFGPGQRLMTGTLVAFAGAMTGLVLADNLLVLYVFWELTTVSSFILIGAARPDRAEDRRAAVEALLMTTAFGLVMLAGFVLLGQAGGTYKISALLADPPGGAAAEVGVVLVLLGAFAKSAQVPLHAWLPAAMVAPTPVSAYLHAAAMVKAGVYLVARLAPAFADTGVWRPMVIVAGLASLFVGGLVALRQDDLKRLLAYGTVSQLGLLMILLGDGTPTAALAGAALLLAHGLFKAPLFLAVGVLEHETGTRRAERLSGEGRRMPVLTIAGAAAVASMIGLPPFLGFVAKEAAIKAFAHGGADAAVLAGVVTGSALTVAYGARFLNGAFGGAAGEGRRGESWGLAGPVVVLAAAGSVLGVIPGTVQKLVKPYARTLEPGSDYDLALWHGFGLVLGLSALGIGVGAVVYFAFGRSFPARRERDVRWRVPDVQRAYDGVIEAVLNGAHAVTRRVQIGSLPVYLGVIAATVLVLPGTALAAGLIGGRGPSGRLEELRAWDDPVQPVLAVVVAGCALAAVRARRRLSAALLLAGVGYGTGGLFVMQGAPDLALTLLVVETLSLIMLVLVLRRLPERFPPWRRTTPGRVATGAISLGIGGFVAVFLVVAALSRGSEPVGPRYAGPAQEEGAKNIVNLILVELRALDTLGEIAVLAVAAMGVAGLVMGRPGAWRRIGPEAEGTEAGGVARTRWLATPGRPPLGGSSVVLEAAARLLGPTILVFSIYLLIAGHGHPGGGFVGGLVAGMAFVLRYLPGGRRELATAVPLRPTVLLGGGLGLAAATGAAGWTSGGEFLRGEILHASVPVIGDIDLPTSLFFDIGVYLLVLGLVLTILTTLGASLEDDLAEEARAGEERA
ncbi:Na+/H+ antiporter subunit A [Actinomadura sp. 3N508]|uniref:Na+/H+ antiporter subunit A n=1 Tax=Actinomadura sp. 3N508 TaxID=3375153 RepID=UPI0037B73353